MAPRLLLSVISRLWSREEEDEERFEPTDLDAESQSQPSEGSREL